MLHGVGQLNRNVNSSFLYRYQKKSAKLIQEFTASANEVSHKFLSTDLLLE